MGAVYEARHNGTGRRCAVKVIAGEALAKSADIVSRFQREAMASGAIESQYIAQVTDTGVDPQSGSPYIVMELLVGEDVEQAVKRLGPLPPDVALRVAAQACLGLQKAHEAGVVHRDIKPANIFLTRRDGGEILAKLLDFGIAKVRADPLSSPEGKSLTRTGSMLGSPLYMSPEQAVGEKTLDHRTDIWSLGVVMYEALTGATPHPSAETVGALIVKICSEPSPPVQELAPWVPPEVAAIVHRALALDPAARWASASEMYAAVRVLLPGGHALDESMLVPLSAEAKQSAAARFSLPGDVRAPVPQSPSSRLSIPDASGAVVRGTMAGTSESIADEPSRGRGLPRSRSVVPIVLGLAVAACVAVGAWVSSRTQPVVDRSAATGLVEPQSAMPPAPTAPPPVADRTGRLVVLPANVRTEVDGAEVVATNGTVAIVGPLGSTHHVRLSSAGRERLADVVMTSDGVVPALVDLDPSPAPTAAPPPPRRVVAAAPPPSEPAEPRKNALRMDMK
jgi:serine/threonine-protein kinase